MMCSPYVCDETSSKQQLPIASKSVTTAYEFGTMGPYIADDEHEDDHMMSSPYLCDETSEKQPLAIASKSVTTAYEFGTWGPFSR